MSIVLAAAGLGVGFAVAVVLGSAHQARQRPVRWLAESYVHVFRGVPLVLMILLVHQLIGERRILGFDATPFSSAVVALILYSSAYQADIIRTGMRSVPTGIVDSARLAGSSSWQVYRLVKLPYSLRVMQPALSGQGITLFKDTSVVVIIGVADLTTTARIVLGGTSETLHIGWRHIWSSGYFISSWRSVCHAWH